MSRSNAFSPSATCERVALVCLLAMAGPPVVQADQITVKGDVLRGTVISVTTSTIVIETVYGTGTLEIAHEDVEQIETDAPYVVLHSDEGRATGRLLGLEEGMLLVGENAASAERIPTASIVTTMAAATLEGSETSIKALRARWRYWRANADVAFSASQSTIDTQSLLLGFRAERTRAPTRFVTALRYHYGTKKERGEERGTTENELYGSVRFERDIADRWFGFASIDGEYDEVERISIRTVPKTGLGYRVVKTEHAGLSVTAGPAWLYERFFGGDDNDAVSLAFGTEAWIDLPMGARFTATIEYIPALDDWTQDYLLRSEAALTIPMLEWVAVKASIHELYDGTPAENTQRNELVTALGLSLLF